MRLDEKINSLRDRLYLVAFGASGITWVLQVFGDKLKHLFNV
jgi:hypothetical protein